MKFKTPIARKEPIYPSIESIRESWKKKNLKSKKSIKALASACNIEKLAENAYDEILDVFQQESHHILRRCIIYLEYMKKKTLNLDILSLALEKYEGVTLYHFED